MNIRIEPHTLQRAIERETSEEEIIETLQSGQPLQRRAIEKEKAKFFYLTRKEMEDFMKRKSWKSFI